MEASGVLEDDVVVSNTVSLFVGVVGDGVGGGGNSDEGSEFHLYLIDYNLRRFTVYKAKYSKNGRLFIN